MPANYTEQDLYQFFEDECARLGLLAGGCDMLAMQFSQRIYNALSGDIPANQVCDALHLCDNATTTISQVSSPSKPACEICEFVLFEIAHALPHNFTVGALDTSLDRICAGFTAAPKLQSECYALVTVYGQDLFAILTGATPYSTVCRALSLCY